MSKHKTRLRWDKAELVATGAVCLMCLGILAWMFFSIEG
jgi:tRNA(Arg) A34 adenosine deaminase TadA